MDVTHDNDKEVSDVEPRTVRVCQSEIDEQTELRSVYAFIDTDAVRVAASDGDMTDDTDDAEVLTDEDDECETCAELSDLQCFECYMKERGHTVDERIGNQNQTLNI